MSIRKTTQGSGRTQQRKLAELPVTDIDEDEGDGLTCALYGRSGSGKTTLSATWPGPILYIDVTDRGRASIRDVKGIKRLKVTTFEAFEEAYWWLKENPEAYNTVIVDTVTQLQRIVVEEIGGAAAKKKGKNLGDWGTMTKQDWGKVAGILKEWLINYRDLAELGINIVFIAQDRAFNLSDDEDLDEESLAPEIGPALSPSVAKTLNASVDVIGNTFVRTRTIKGDIKKKTKDKEVTEYCLRLGPNPLYVTKVRKPKSIEAPAVIVDPDYDEIMAIIEGE